MSDDHELDDRRVDPLLSGQVDAAAGEDPELAHAVDTIRAGATAGARPVPNEELLRVFAEGIVPAPTASPHPGEATRKRTPLLGRVAVRRPLAKLAGLSLLVKLSLGGAAIAATAVGGAGVAGVLPGQPDDLPPAEEADAGRDTADDAVDGGVVGGEASDAVRDLRDERGADPGDRGQNPPTRPSGAADGDRGRTEEGAGGAPDAGDAGAGSDPRGAKQSGQRRDEADQRRDTAGDRRDDALDRVRAPGPAPDAGEGDGAERRGGRAPNAPSGRGDAESPVNAPAVGDHRAEHAGEKPGAGGAPGAGEEPGAGEAHGTEVEDSRDHGAGP